MTEVLADVPEVALKDSAKSPSLGSIDGSGTLCGEKTWPEDTLHSYSSM